MTTKKFLILGGGQQGCKVARLLRDNVHNCEVTVADINRNLDFRGKTEYFNASDVSGNYRNIIGKWWTGFDVVAGCLPSHFGAACVHLAAEFGVNYIDLSFTNEDLFQYDQLARLNGATIVPDCGLAPGMPNLIVGKFMGELDPGEKLEPVEIFVGGVAKDRKLPFGYVETWSLEDLYEEYTRPGRFVSGGHDYQIDPLNLDRLETVKFGQNEYEAFTSDGLRTLLKYKSIIPDMKEYTLRYPGHMEQIKELLASLSFQGEPITKAQFVEAFRKKLEPGFDKVLLRVACGNATPVEMIVHGDKMCSAMARTTAGFCASMVSWLYNHTQDTALEGVVSLEHIGSRYYHEVHSHLKQVADLYLSGCR